MRRSWRSVPGKPTERQSGRAGWIENRPTSGVIVWPSLAELAAYREVVLFLALRQLQIRYKQTYVGVAWTILQPLAAATIFTFVFDRLIAVPVEGVPYLVFAFAGLAAWMYFSGAVGGATWSLVENEELVTKTYFPRLLAPVAAVVPGVLDLAIWLVVLAAVMVVAGVAPTLAVLTLPLWIAGLVLLAFGVGALLSALHVRYRDIGHLLPFLTQGLLLLSPVAYPSSLVKGDAAALYSLNPLVGLLDGFRWATVGAPAPGTEALLGLPVGLAVVAAGLLHFGRVERRFADVI